MAVFSISSSAHAEWHGDARPKMGTEISVYLWHEDAVTGEAIIEEIFAEVDRINELMSTYVESSRISEINRRAAAEPTVAGDELFQLIRRSLDISVLTRGAFDITYESVGQHYDFRERQRPDEATIAAERQHIDYRLVELDQAAGTVRFLEDGVRINLGGIAKGYVVERGVDLLRRHGVENGIVTAGGDSRLLGDRRGRPWMVGIRDPRNDGQVAISVPLEDEAISTSGDYERYFEEDGIRYHHIIQPNSGLPVDGVHSATVFGPDAVLTDALSTSVFVMGVDEGLKLIGCLPDYESIVIDADSQIYYSTGLQQPDAATIDSPPAATGPGSC
ncbi:MAG: FAD:protein FMN transferase [Woeseiaceae bacterium]|nr:FAD:protein FMN transferase [Woeseiaceae bacterium]